MKYVEIVGAALVISVFFLALPGCDNPKGPVEKAGAKVDDSVQGAGKQMEKAGDSIQDATTPDRK